MPYSPQTVKDTLLNLVSDMQNNSWLYTIHPEDYTRQRKISFGDTLLSTISMQKSSSKVEILKYFDFKNSTPTSSALIQQRKKVSLKAFEDLFFNFTKAFPCDQTIKGYDPIAVDGSDIYIPRNPADSDTFRISDKYGKGYNMMHLNAAYHLKSHLYTDVILQPQNSANEYQAMCDLIDSYAAAYPSRKPLFIADRGYAALNIFAHAIENNAYFLIRARDNITPETRTLLSTLELPKSPEYDIIFERWLTRVRKNSYRTEPEVYKSIQGRVFDYLAPGNKSLYYICFRIVHFQLPNGKSETIFTNLPREDFSNEELRELYNMRWGIETSFRDIKYAAGLLHFHSRKKELILQEIYAKLILYNFTELITSTVVVEKKDRKYSYRINFTVAVAVCTEFLRQSKSMIDVYLLLARELVPERPGRSNPRYIKARTATSFLYR